MKKQVINIRVDLARERILRSVNGKRRWTPAVRCQAETCRPREIGDTSPYREPGCDDCFRGLIPKKPEAACCCSGPRELRCQNCLEAYGLVHVCQVESEEEIDRQVRLMTLPPEKTAEISEGARRKAARLEEATRLGAPLPK